MTHRAATAGTVGFLTAPGLYRDLLVRKATGQLVAYRGETVKKVFFKSGSVLYATSNLPADRLGDVLLARGAITREQYDESARQVREGRKQGTALVQIGALAPKDLFRGLIDQVREIAMSLVAWDEGAWRFFEAAPPQDEVINLRLRTEGLIFEGLARICRDPRFAAHWSAERLALRPAASPPFASEELDVPDTVRRLFTLVGEGRPLPLGSRPAGLDRDEANAALYGLSLLGMVEADAAPRPAPRRAAPHPTAAAPATRPDVDEAEARRLRERVIALAAHLDSLSHYQLLGVTPVSDADAIKRAYLALAKEYDPDRFFRPQFDDVQERVNAIFLRVNEAYSTLQNPAAREDYDRRVLQLKAPAGRVQSPTQDSRLAHQQFAKGIALLNGGDLWSAIQALRWAVNLSPHDPRYQTWLGVALTRTKKRLHEAEEHCKAAIALDSANADYYVNLGQVYRTGHLYDRAKKQFETALRLDPKHQGALKEIRDMEGPAPDRTLIDRLRRK